ncbi:unnamed protein product [Caenorhabditis sp. 36 PRJEB53466]|nr:unnamed protein product [Caenorhabditis sp. 36 PRJEB53466]
MRTASYRLVDVDSLDEFEESESFSCASDGPNESEVRGFLESNQLEKALISCLFPLFTTDQEEKDRVILLVSSVLNAFKHSEIEETASKLSTEQGDVLMKYVYKAMELSADSHTLLSWHSCLVSKFGHGAIMRVFTCRNRL